MFMKASYANLFSVWLLIFIFGELILQSICQERYHSKCFNVEQRNVCYFMVNDTRTDWESAWSTCRNMNASLPVISSVYVQTLLKNYLSQNVSNSCVWTAGRYIADNQWRWVNGQPLKNEGLLQNISLATSRGVNTILNSELKYETRSSTESNYYICQFSGVHCNSSNSLSWKGDCLVESSIKLTYKWARRACIEGGGDLATFTEDGDLQLVSDRLNRGKNYWIGLRRNLLIWNTSDTIEDIKNLSLDINDRAENGCLLLLVPGYRLQLTSCSDKKRFVCQTEFTQPTTEKINPVFAFTNILIGVVVGSVLLLFLLISAIIIIERNKRKARTKADVETDIDKSYEVLHRSGVVDNGFYTDLKPTQLGRNVQYYEDPLYEDL